MIRPGEAEYGSNLHRRGGHSTVTGYPNAAKHPSNKPVLYFSPGSASRGASRRPVAAAIRRFLPTYDSPRPPRTFHPRCLFCRLRGCGSVLQRKVGAQSSQDESQLRDSLKSFTDVYALVEQNYAEPIDGDKADTAIYDGAIPGMLRVLDPHSNFYDPKGLRQDARRPARPLLRRRHDHPAAEQQGLRRYPVRGNAVVPGRHSPRRHHLRRRRQVHRRHDL